MITANDRLEKLLEQSARNGIDFIYVQPEQPDHIILDVYFLKPDNALASSFASQPLTTDQVRIYSSAGVTVKVKEIPPLPLADDDTGKVLRLITEKPIAFTIYKLSINDDRMDPYYNHKSFSFQAGCPSDLDCKPVPRECPPEELVDFPVNYLARDFWSFRRSLLDFASLRYPGWPDRLEADAGIMLAELMSAAGDEMAYYQDRIGREAFLESATQPRSLKRHASLVDYNIYNALGAFAWLDITAEADDVIPAGAPFWAQSESGLRIEFEAGNNLREAIKQKKYPVKINRNQFEAYRWDLEEKCLFKGATQLYIKGHHESTLLPFDDLSDAKGGKWVLLKTIHNNPGQPLRAHMVRVIEVKDETDPVFGEDITRLVWEEAQALPFDMDMTVLFVRANIIPLTAGKTYELCFITGAAFTELSEAEQQALVQMQRGKDGITTAVEREGNNNSITYLCSLPSSETSGLVWLGNDPQQAMPEVYLEELRFSADTWLPVNDVWTWRRSFVGLRSSQSLDKHFILEDGTWRKVVTYQRDGEEFIHRDYASPNGATIRFGNGEFGLVPAEKSVFRVYYRVGGGQVSNVAPESITGYDEAALPFVTSCYNPLSAVNGKNAETAGKVRESAPEAFRAITYRAVRPEDYAEAVERLSFVQKANASFRYTGSWLTAFVNPDIKSGTDLSNEYRKQLTEQLNRFRQAGREVHIMDAVYVDLDMEINICVAPDGYAGEVKERVLNVLLGKTGGPRSGYFSSDNFTFGQMLSRSALEAVIQAVPGVRTIEEIKIRRRGIFGWRTFSELLFDPGPNAIIRIENDPLHPERGILSIKPHGGA